MQEFTYCPICSNELLTGYIDGRDRKKCSKCDWIDYKNPVPVVACIVADCDGNILLIKRGVPPCEGRWALPGGFIELNETLAEAGLRELFEETGLRGKPGRLINVEIQDSDRYGNVLVAGMQFYVDKIEIKIGDDAVDAKFFTVEDMPQLPFKSHSELVKLFIHQEKNII